MTAPELALRRHEPVSQALAAWLGMPPASPFEVDAPEIGAAVLHAISTDFRRHGVVRLKLLDRAGTLEVPALERLLLGISSTLGFVVPQTHRHNAIARIQDEGNEYALHTTRGHQTSAALAFHSDRCDVNLLLYVRVAPRGGDLSVVSYAAAAARLRERDETAWASLFGGFPFDLREERIFPSLKWHWRPILWHHGEAVRGHYIRRFIADSQRHADCPRLTCDQLHALDRFDEVLEDLREDHTFSPQPGELLLLDNYRVMHARSSFVDRSEAHDRRLALRTWVAPFDSEALPPALHPLAGSCDAGSYRGGVGVGEEFLSMLGRKHAVTSKEH